MIRINFTERERLILSGKKVVGESYRRNVYMNARRKAKESIKNLKFLATYLSEAQQKQIFTPETIADLMEAILAYRLTPHSHGEKLPRMRGEKYTYSTEVETKYDKKYIGIPRFGKKGPPRLPREVYDKLKSGTSPERWETDKIWRGIGGSKFPHPSLRRQYQLSLRILDIIYKQFLEKIDPEQTRRKLMQDYYPVLIFEQKEFRYVGRSSWIYDLLKDLMNEDQSQKLIRKWVKQVASEVGKPEEKIMNMVSTLLRNWLLQLVMMESKALENDRMLIVHR